MTLQGLMSIQVFIILDNKGGDMSNQVQKKDIKVKITDDVLKGVYANQMNVINTREELYLIL